MKRLKITMLSIGQRHAEFSDGAPQTAKAIREALPIESNVSRWVDEIYFAVPVQMRPENPKEVVNLGDLGYWPPGRALCVFFGPTPASRGGEIRPASPVNVFGRLVDDPSVFKEARDGERIRLDGA